MTSERPERLRDRQRERDWETEIVAASDAAAMADMYRKIDELDEVTNDIHASLVDGGNCRGNRPQGD